MDDVTGGVRESVLGMESRADAVRRKGSGMVRSDGALRFRRLGACWVVWFVPACVGCGAREVSPVVVANETLGPMRIAVAPAINVSGSPHLDAARVADLMASELGYVADIEVIPVNRVLAMLASRGRDSVVSPVDALEIASSLGADAILVFAITEYDAYEPPIVAIAAQLYGQRRHARVAGFDPVLESRFGAPPDRSGSRSPLAPIAQAERVFDASHQWVREEIKRFSKLRSADESPYGWRKYVASQQHYLRFCCHETVRRLVGVVQERAPSGTAG